MSQFIVYNFGDRHPRQNTHETNIAYSVIYRELYRLSRERSDPEAAYQLFRVFYRFMYYAPGRPVYPDIWPNRDEGGAFQWSQLEKHLLSWSETMEAPDNVTKEEAEE